MWSQTLGHKKQIDRLELAIKEKRLAHAYLFSGIEGIGKKRVAFGLAQTLLCLKESGPCENCPACVRVAKEIHPDCHVITPQGLVIKVEVLRDLKQKIYLHPLEGNVRVAIFDKAENLTEAGANALLKILEEPPPKTHFILMSSQPSKLLPTIRSRCQKMEFSPLSEEVICKYLLQQGMASEEAGRRVQLCGGSLKAALEFDVELFKTVQDQIKTLKMDPRPSKIFELSESWSEEDEKIPIILTTLNKLWHRRIIQTQTNDNLEMLIHQWQAIQIANRGLESYANKQLLFEDLLFTLSVP